MKYFASSYLLVSLFLNFTSTINLLNTEQACLTKVKRFGGKHVKTKWCGGDDSTAS
jgi:hypothetical protein